MLPKPRSAQQPTGSARPMARLLGQVIMMTTMTMTMMTTMTMTVMVMVMVMITPLVNHLAQGPLPGPPVCRRNGGRGRPVRHCLGDHRRQQVGQWGHQDLQVTIFLRNMFLVTNICRNKIQNILIRYLYHFSLKLFSNIFSGSPRSSPVAVPPPSPGGNFFYSHLIPS